MTENTEEILRNMPENKGEENAAAGETSKDLSGDTDKDLTGNTAKDLTGNAAEDLTGDTAGDLNNAENAGDENAEECKDKKGRRHRHDKKCEELEQKKAELEDRVKRQMAEFENFRKRTEKEKSTMFEMGAKSVVEKLLPIVDNFERGLASITEAQRGPVYEGMNMIYKQLMDELSKLDVKPIECLGEEFNPDLHNAVMQVETKEVESGFIAQEMLKGYTYRGVVVRHSMVAVAQ